MRTENPGTSVFRHLSSLPTEEEYKVIGNEAYIHDWFLHFFSRPESVLFSLVFVVDPSEFSIEVWYTKHLFLN